MENVNEPRNCRGFSGFVLCTGKKACAPGGTDIPVCAALISSRATGHYASQFASSRHFDVP